MLPAGPPRHVAGAPRALSGATWQGGAHARPVHGTAGGGSSAVDYGQDLHDKVHIAKAYTPGKVSGENAH
jgi:hypothetical protein